ncbi:Beta-1,4-mannooligosaccharide phosphorylase [Pirellulimonas nuda]|uniref:Beta-1,4-mannooligosaccharide phosphorylase n=1 Tax=Pirellulimonas nuda TaxID=2528009 RepID=A0A518DCN5_9BACT|nr:glycoside hydrolase family 130 protein [Pirellulimonas nuda]QDU89242.1 Beta-1,4-mannooligosaccharide phosphorylase [Pirellulimonas nuda]
MTLRLSQHRLMGPEDLRPLNSQHDVIGVFNPGAVRFNEGAALIARVAERPCAQRPGFVGLPRYASGGELIVDWTPEAELDRSDPRVVRQRLDGRTRLTSVSHLRVFLQSDEVADRWEAGPAILPLSINEEYGIEDPRITQIDGRYWITYVAVSRHGAATALASTDDFASFERHGVIFPPENKDVVLFPRKIDGKYVALHRPTAKTDFCRPEVWLARSPDLLHWGDHEPLLAGVADWESERVGAGAPPIEVDEGWLMVYHGCGAPRRPGGVGDYCAGAALLDLADPARIVRRASEPIMRPVAEFERCGFVPNVVFPTALIDSGETFTAYYGAADTAVGAAKFSRAALFASLN